MSKVTLRQCVSCRKLMDRSQFIRVVRNRLEQDFSIQWPHSTYGSGRSLMGRSAYLCASASCIGIALKGNKLSKTLKTQVPDDIVNFLKKTLAEGTQISGCD